MVPDSMALTHLLRPVGVEDFFGTFWQQRPLLVPRNDQRYYARLFEFDDVDSILTQHDPREGTIRLAKKGDPAVTDELFDEDGRIDLAKVYSRHAQGATIIINKVHHHSATLAEFCRDIELRLCCPTGINVYLTPKGAQGFDAHFDVHDVFILQITGTKQWRVYGESTRLPLADEPLPAQRGSNLGAPSLEAVLRPGDLLYLPRRIRP